MLALAVLCVGARVAGAVVVREPNGHVLGVTPHAGVAPAAIPGSVAARHSSGSVGLVSTGNLAFHLGQVLHSSAPYLIFWDPGGGVTSSSRALFERYFTDVAADGGKATNVYAVNRQFTDATGFADYQQTFSSGQAIPDTHAYPARDTVNCPDIDPVHYPTCLTDAQLQTEITRLITADGLPQGTGANAPIYFVVTPGTVNICSDAASCADNTFCAYHSSYLNGSSTALYATIPMFFDGASTAQNPKACQSDHNAVVQEPNGDPADVAIKYLSHEDNETITDPVNGGGWWDNNSGNEDGDNCNAFGTFTPTNGTNPNAFLPTLGGSASAGTLFNQSINGNRYYIQSEWSNGDVNCEMQPSAGTITASFTVSGPQAAGNQLTFDPSASTSTTGYSSVTWQWGDGTPDTFSAGGPAITHHTFASPGQRLVTLTLVDTSGNLSTSSVDVAVGIPPIAAFTLVPASVMTGSPVSFDASGSTDPNAVAINSYQWNFGDGSSGAGATTTHSYAARGSYTVTLTVTDSIGFSSAPVTRQVTVLAPPTPAFAASPANPGAGSIVSFNAGASSDPNHGVSVSSYSWSFGDGTADASAVTTRHAYAAAGTYPVTLTVTDSLGLSASTVEQVVVDELPTARIGVKTAHPAARVAVAFDGSGSRDTDGAIASYRWSFGDGSAPSSGAAPKHTYARAGTYRVVLTVTDGSGQTAAAASSLKVAVDSRIVKTALATTKKGRFLLVVVDGAGVVRAGSTKVTLRRAGTAKIRLALSAAGRRTLREKHRVAVTLTITYVPVIGPAVSKRLRVVVRG